MTLGLDIVVKPNLLGFGVVLDLSCLGLTWLLDPNARPKRFGFSKYLGFDVVVRPKSLGFGTKKIKARATEPNIAGLC
jgi:hypothetical protein